MSVLNMTRNCIWWRGSSPGALWNMMYSLLPLLSGPLWSIVVCFFCFFCLMAHQIRGLFNAKVMLLEEQQYCYLTHSWDDKGIHAFSKGICPKGKVIAQLEFEFAYYDSAVQQFNHYNTMTPPIYSGSTC